MEQRSNNRHFFKQTKFSSLTKEIRIIMTNPEYSWVICLLLLVMEVIITSCIILKVPYTEIDWRAYMQEVEGVLNGTYDYKLLKGDTGPLVYPAGFIYIYSILYYITNNGSNILFAQFLFTLLYLASLYAVFRLYVRSNIVPPYALIFMCCTSYRIHSIFVLRLFNDPVAVFFLICAINCFCDDKWIKGSILFSFAVSVKMNILLFAPGIFYVMVYSIGLHLTLHCIAICAVVQLLVGLPFLLTSPWSYLSCAFDLGRVFLYEWTVNWRFLSEEIFLNRSFHAMLLCLHLCALSLFAFSWIKNFGFGVMKSSNFRPLSCDNILFILFVSNFIGVVFSRSLHYQFYVWYFFTLPHLLWSTSYTPMAKLCVLGVIELSWNTYPSTILSSSALFFCHALILCNLMYLSFKMIEKKTGKKGAIKTSHHLEKEHN